MFRFEFGVGSNQNLKLFKAKIFSLDNTDLSPKLKAYLSDILFGDAFW